MDMQLIAKGFRKMSDSSKPSHGIRESKTEPFILIKKSGEISYANKPEAKDELVAQYIEGEDVLLFPWIGKWSTDVFILNNEVLASYGFEVSRK